MFDDEWEWIIYSFTLYFSVTIKIFEPGEAQPCDMFIDMLKN